MSEALGCTIEQASRAQHAISGIDARISQAKSRRQQRAFVYQFPRDEYKPPRGPETDIPFDIEWLSGSARMVYSHCVERGLKPTVEIIGWAAQPNIVAHW